MSERSLQEGKRAQGELLLPPFAPSLILGWVGERGGESDAIEAGCYIRDVGGVSSTQCGGRERKKNRQRDGDVQEEGGGEGLVWMQCKVSSFSL